MLDRTPCTDELTGAQIVLRTLADLGVEVIFGYPGGAVLPIYDELLHQNSVRHILVRHEAGAVHAAEGYARATGKPGVVLVTSGPGITNAVTGLADAFMDSIPLLVISGQVPTHLIGTDAFQECDTVGITRHCTKYNYLVKQTSRLEVVLREGYAIASTGRPGPVVVDVPRDVQVRRAMPAPSRTQWTRASYEVPYTPVAADIEAAVSLLQRAQRPIFYTGGSGKIAALFNFLGSILGNGVPFAPVTLTNCPSLNAQNVPNGAPSQLTLKEDNVSWRAGLDYRVAEGTLLYANISRGYKAGSYPLLPASSTAQYRPVKQEAVTAYEAGLKTDLFGRNAHINAAAFYYAYRDKQVLGKIVDPIFNQVNALVNVPKSRVLGLESDVSIKPTDGLTLSGSATYLDSKIQRYKGFNFIGSFLDFKGSELPFAPKWSYGFDVDYRYKLSSGGVPFAGVSVNGQTSQDTVIGGSALVLPTGPSIRVTPGLTHPFQTKSYATIDIRFGYEAPSGVWKVMAFGKNVFNKYYFTNVVDQSEVAQRYAGMPATYGVTLGVKLN